MNILLINTTFGHGGAAQIVMNLAAEFDRMGLSVQSLVAGTQEHSFAKVRTIHGKRGVFERICNRLSTKLGLSNSGILQTFKLPWDQDFKNADVLSLHNLHGGYFNFLALPLLTRQVPAILTLHDMWPITGHCVYSFDCERWKVGCGKCPYPLTYQAIERDATHLEYLLKRWSFRHSQIHFVAISQWIYKVAKMALGDDAPVHFIPNGIDLEIFSPIPENTARQALGIPVNKQVILFAAHRLDDPRKGFDILVKALEQLSLSLRQNTLLLVMGDAGEGATQNLAVEVNYLGFVDTDLEKVKVFSAADVFAFPTRADNLPIVLQESLACGLPMVSFAVGGVPDLVRHEKTGLLAPAEDVQRFAEYLEQVLRDDSLRDHMSVCCRKLAEDEYSLQLQAQRYQTLFQNVSHSL